MPQQLDLVEGERAAQLAGLDALHVVHVAENARDDFRLIASRVADRIANQVNRPAFRLRRRSGGQRQRRRGAAVDLRPFHFQQRQIVLLVDADHGANAIARAGHALAAGTVVHPGRDAGTELPGVAAVLDEDFSDPPRRHQDVVVDEEPCSRPVVFRMAEQLDAADAALGHLHILALVLQQVPQRRYGAEVAAADENGRPTVQEQDGLQPACLVRRQVGRAAQDLIQPGRPGLQYSADGLALLTGVRFTGRPNGLAPGDGRGHRGFDLGVRRPLLPNGPPQRRPQVGRLLPAAHLLPILPHDGR